MRNEIKFIKSFIESEEISGQEMLDVLSDIGIVTDIVLGEGDTVPSARRVWVPHAPHVCDMHWIRLVHGEPIAFIQCSDPECLESHQVDCPSDLTQLPPYHG